MIGPITPKLHNGALWAAKFTDDYSRCRWVYSFKQKNEAFPTTMNFIKYVKTQHNRNTKVLLMDNGNEYGGGKLLEFFKQKGMRQEATVPYTPEQDGGAE